jgi:hypothetical protein
MRCAVKLDRKVALGTEGIHDVTADAVLATKSSRATVDVAGVAKAAPLLP